MNTFHTTPRPLPGKPHGRLERVMESPFVMIVLGVVCAVAAFVLLVGALSWLGA